MAAYIVLLKSLQLLNLFINKLKVDTKVSSPKNGLLILQVESKGLKEGIINVELSDEHSLYQFKGEIKDGIANISCELKDCLLWSPKDPHLYILKVSLGNKNETVDEYSLPVGIRDVKILGNKLLINNEEVYLKGFGKHEDYSIIGKGLFLPLMVKDFELMKWINANSFRTSHYPYAEELMFYADKKGILVIDEVPAISLDFRNINENTLLNHKEYINRIIDRDYNHPCIIIWAVGNEPNIVGAEKYYDGCGRKYWKEIFEYTRELDNSRLVTVPNCTRAGINDPVFEFSGYSALIDTMAGMSIPVN